MYLKSSSVLHRHDPENDASPRVTWAEAAAADDIAELARLVESMEQRISVLEEGRASNERKTHEGYERIWVPTHGTDEMFDEWTVERYSADDIEYVRADIAQTMSDQLVEAHQRIDELLRERDELRAETERLRALVEGE